MTLDTDPTLIRKPVTLPARSFPRGPADLRAFSSWSTPDELIRVGAAAPAAGDIIHDRFVLEKPLGRGSMGTVFSARYLHEEQARYRDPCVAIKFFNEDVMQQPGVLRSLRHEFLESRKLAHPNIVTVWELDRYGAQVYMVMELLEGMPLDHLIKLRQDVGLGVKDAVRVMRGLCRAMDYAHAQGHIHSNFTPASAFITTSGVAKVFDFGIARAAKADAPAEADGLSRRDSRTFGALTPAYAGSEVCEGLAPTPSDDLYAMACVTYELITGFHPFNRLSARQAEKARMTPARPPGMSASQWRALRRGLSFRRDGRPRSATQFLDAIRSPTRSVAVYAAIGTATVVSVALAAVPLWKQVDGFRARGQFAVPTPPDTRRVEPAPGAPPTLEPARPKVDPESPLVSDARPPAALGARSERALDPGQPALASPWVATDLAVAPHNKALTGLPAPQHRLETQLVRRAREIESREGLQAAVKFTQQMCARHPDSTQLGQMLTQLLATAAQREAAAVASAKSETEALLAHPTLDDSWDSALQQQLTQLATYTPHTDPYVQDVRGRAAAMYVTEAAQLRGTKLFDQADRMLEHSRAYSSQSAAAAVEEALLDDARARQRIGDRKSDRAAYVNSLKHRLIAQAQDNDVTSAETTLRVLRESLAANDRFMTHEAPRTIAQAYERLALQAAGNGQLQSAVELINHGEAAAPNLESIAAAQARYMRYQVLEDGLTNGPVPNVLEVRAEISALIAQDPRTAQALVPVLARALAARVHSTREPQLAAGLTKAGNAIFGYAAPSPRD